MGGVLQLIDNSALEVKGAVRAGLQAEQAGESVLTCANLVTAAPSLDILLF